MPDKIQIIFALNILRSGFVVYASGLEHFDHNFEAASLKIEIVRTVKILVTTRESGDDSYYVQLSDISPTEFSSKSYFLC